jgi:hypothetical protein
MFRLNGSLRSENVKKTKFKAELQSGHQEDAVERANELVRILNASFRKQTLEPRPHQWHSR